MFWKLPGKTGHYTNLESFHCLSKKVESHIRNSKLQELMELPKGLEKWQDTKLGIQLMHLRQEGKKEWLDARPQSSIS